MRFLFFYSKPWEKSPWYMAASHYQAKRNAVLYVIYPFNFLVSLAYYVQDRWAKHTNNPSWIEREVRRRTVSTQTDRDNHFGRTFAQPKDQ